MSRRGSLAALFLLPAACGVAPAGGETSDIQQEERTAEAIQAIVSPFAIDVRQSLEATDTEVVSRFKLKDVMQALLTQAGSTQTPTQLFQQMFATELAASPPGVGPGPNCASTFNGFSFQCPRIEGNEALSDPFIDDTSPQTYEAVAVANRFDLADSAAGTCGQYRISFARRSGAGNPPPGSTRSPFLRNFIIFEAQVTNPRPALGLLGCAPIVTTWLSLSDPTMPPATRGQKLHDLFFNGIPTSNVPPLIQVDNYGGGGHGGQVRTNQFMQNVPPIPPQQPWMLREFALNHSCTAGVCSVVLKPATVKQNPSATLFVPGATGAAHDFQNQVLLDPGVLRSISAATDVNLLNYNAPDTFNTGESNSIDTGVPLAEPVAQPGAQHTDYLAAFGTAPSALSNSMASELASIGSTLTPQQVVNRIQSLSCAGCHLLSTDGPPDPDHTDLGMSLPFPPIAPAGVGFPFTHTNELTEVIPTTEGGDGTRTRHQLSQALLNAFLPFRRNNMAAFLATVPAANLGFEQAGAWSASQATIALVSTPTTQGASSLKVTPTSGFCTVTSPTLSTSDFGASGSKLSLDFFKSATQPNPSWDGFVAVFVSIPSAGINNQPIGQIDILPLPTGFSTLKYTLPAAVSTALQGSHTDVSLQITLNVNSGSGPYFLDDIRLTN